MIRYVLLGFAVGGRTTAGPAALAWSGSNARAKQLTAIGAAVELVGDKLPQTPSRLELGGLVARGVASAASAIVLARREGDDQRIAAAVALVAAGVGATLGSRWRTRAAARNVAAGLAEDAVVATLASLAVAS